MSDRARGSQCDVFVVFDQYYGLRVARPTRVRIWHLVDEVVRNRRSRDRSELLCSIRPVNERFTNAGHEQERPE